MIKMRNLTLNIKRITYILKQNKEKSLRNNNTLQKSKNK